MVYIRETAAFGGISLALRGSTVFGGGKRKNKQIFGATGAPLGSAKKKIYLKKKLPQGHEYSEFVLVLKLDNGKWFI